MQGCRRLTSGFAFGPRSEMRVSRVFFSGLAQPALRMPTQGVRGAMRPMSCGFESAGTLTAPNEALMRTHAQGMRTHCPAQRDLPRSPANVVGSESAEADPT